MKQVLSVQDLSCVGKCSLTLALPVLSAMGVSCSVLPTAVLSTHTGFSSPHVRDLTQDMHRMRSHWQQIGATFDAISVGYLSDPEQVREVALLAEAFPRAQLILDPAMGDHGKLYSRLTQDPVTAVKTLCPKAAVVIPNVTEAAFLTGLPLDTPPHLLADAVAALGAETVVITGVSLEPGKTGFLGKDAGGYFRYQADVLPGVFHGTGDLFAAVLTGAWIQRNDLYTGACLAAQFVERCIRDQEPSAFGVEFEKWLPWLWQKMNG